VYGGAEEHIPVQRGYCFEPIKRYGLLRLLYLDLTEELYRKDGMTSLAGMLNCYGKSVSVEVRMCIFPTHLIWRDMKGIVPPKELLPATTRSIKMMVTSPG
jgi:hypothetical protein